MKRVDALTSGDKNMVTSDAVYNAVIHKLNVRRSPWGVSHQFNLTRDNFYMLITASPNFSGSGGGMNLYLVMAPHPNIPELTGYVQTIQVEQPTTSAAIIGDVLYIDSPQSNVAILLPLSFND